MCAVWVSVTWTRMHWKNFMNGQGYVFTPCVTLHIKQVFSAEILDLWHFHHIGQVYLLGP